MLTISQNQILVNHRRFEVGHNASKNHKATLNPVDALVFSVHAPCHANLDRCLQSRVDERAMVASSPVAPPVIAAVVELIELAGRDRAVDLAHTLKELQAQST